MAYIKIQNDSRIFKLLERTHLPVALKSYLVQKGEWLSLFWNKNAQRAKTYEDFVEVYVHVCDMCMYMQLNEVSLWRKVNCEHGAF